MGKISVLDCTLRDGGYINDWRFGNEAIRYIISALDDTGVEFIEIGFIRGDSRDPDRAVYTCINDASAVIPKNHTSKIVGMIDMKTPVPLDRLKPMEHGLDAIRIIFRKELFEESFEYISNISKLGYQTMVQIASTDIYSDMELMEIAKRFNSIKPFAVYIVDTLGLMNKNDVMRIAYLFDHNLDKNITLGYHSHNNLQQARGNAEALVEANLDRNVIIDACVYGMGRGAGNLNEELFVDYLNRYHSKDYKVSPMLDIIDKYLNAIHKEHYWGYSLPYYLSAKNHVHPYYAKYYSEKGTLTENTFDELLRTIKKEDSHIFNIELAEKYYVDFMNSSQKGV